MFNGWLSFAGTELLNEERVRAYVENMVPTLRMPTRCAEENRDLAALLDDAPYRTPLMDEAPWVDPDDSDTYDFCGAFPLSVSGLTDSTRTATVVQSTSDGGSVAGRRRGTKEVRVTALLIGQTNAAVEAGKRWLAAALDGGCDPCEPGELCFLVGDGSGELALGDYVTQTIKPSSLTGPASYWQSGSGVFKPTTTAQAVQTPQAPSPLPCDEIFWHWKISSATAGTTVIFETLGESGVTSSVGYTLTATGGTFTISDRGTSDQKSWSRMRVLSAPGETVTISSVDMEFRSDAPEDACFSKYMRQLRRVACVSGPVTIEEFEPSAGAMEKVEFSFVAEMPYIYGYEEDIISVTGSVIAASKSGADAFQLSTTIPACTVPKATPLVTDPACPPIALPPRRTLTPVSCGDDPDYLRSYALVIPDEVIPLWSEAVPILSIKTNSSAARKVQVRFLPRPFDIQTIVDLDPCSSCGEFVIDYIPPWSTFVLNGMEERAYIKQSGGRVSDAGHLLSGMTTSTLFRWPVLTCGSGYYAVIDMASSGVGRLELSIAGRS